MEQTRIVEYGPYPGGVAVVQVTTNSRHLDLDGIPALKDAVSKGKPLMLSADHQVVLYTWAPTSAGMVVAEGCTGASLGSVTQMGAYMVGRTPIPEMAPYPAAGLVVKGPSGPSVLRLWWGM